MSASRGTLVAVVAVAIGSVFGGIYNVFPADDYNPRINPSDFTTNITNTYFSLPVGKKMVFGSKTAKGTERTEIQITGETREVMGVQTLVYWDRVWLNGKLVEETKDYLAQDREGNVWYFGEDINNYVNGKLANHDGSWLAGVDSAKAGIWFKGNPRVGDNYRQEYHKGQAEDMAEVLAVNETVTTRRGTFKNCVKTYDWTPLEPGVKEHKFYCPEAGGLVLVMDLQTGKRTELADVSPSSAVASAESKASAKMPRSVSKKARDDGDDEDDDEDRDDHDDRDDDDRRDDR